MKTYEAIYNKSEVKGVYGISLVENPAMKGLFIALTESQPIQFKAVDDNKRLVAGLVLRANFPVFRKGEVEDYNIVFSENTIKDLAHGFYENNYHSNSSIEHLKKIEGVTFVESWLVEDPNIDKTKVLNLESQAGDWFTILKIDNDEVWNDFTKTGKVKGFSIDAMVELKEIKNNENMDVKEIINAIKLGFASLAFGTVKSADESVSIEFDGDALAVGGDVWVLDANGDKVPLPIGEYPLADNKILVVLEVGKIGEVNDVVVAENATPEATAAETPMTDAKQTAEIATAVENAIKSIMIKYNAEVSTEILALKTQILELSKQPAAKPIVSTPTQKNTFSYND